MNRTIGRPGIVAVLLLTSIAVFSVSNIVTIPRVFFDEALTIEIARNIQLFGIPDVSVAPGHFTGVPYITGSSGYPITMPLALFFNIFGFGFLQSRIYALLWFLSALLASWYFVKQFWGPTHAVAALSLLSGFASLHDSGHRVMGDVPGFALMLLGLFFLFRKNAPHIAGVLFGLALAAKPSVYLLIFPAIVVTLTIVDWKSAFRKLILIAIGAFIPVTAWIILQFPNPFSLQSWQNVLAFYGNAYGSAYAPWESILRNLKNFGSQTTLMYFSVLAVPTLVAFREKLRARETLPLFIAAYGFFDVCYFLRSPGTIRYLLPLELLIILLMPATLSWWIERMRLHFVALRIISHRLYWLGLVIGLACFHLLQFVFFSSVLAKNTAHLETLKYLSRFQSETIGVVSSPHIAAFLPAERKFHYLRLTDEIIFGTNPLALPIHALPEIVIIPADYVEAVPLTNSEANQLRRYELVKSGKWEIYKLR